MLKAVNETPKYLVDILSIDDVIVDNHLDYNLFNRKQTMFHNYVHAHHLNSTFAKSLWQKYCNQISTTVNVD